MSTRRGKKINPAKNAGSARDFAAGKKIGRPAQQWVWDVEPVIITTHEGKQQTIKPGSGHWEKVTNGTK
jgi:hypothetical protein